MSGKPDAHKPAVAHWQAVHSRTDLYHSTLTYEPLLDEVHPQVDLTAFDFGSTQAPHAESCSPDVFNCWAPAFLESILPNGPAIADSMPVQQDSHPSSLVDFFPWQNCSALPCPSISFVEDILPAFLSSSAPLEGQIPWTWSTADIENVQPAAPPMPSPLTAPPRPGLPAAQTQAPAPSERPSLLVCMYCPSSFIRQCDLK